MNRLADLGDEALEELLVQHDHYEVGSHIHRGRSVRISIGRGDCGWQVFVAGLDAMHHVDPKATGCHFYGRVADAISAALSPRNHEVWDEAYLRRFPEKSK